LALSLLSALLSACADPNRLPAPLAVEIPDTCERLLVPVAIPGGPKDDARVVARARRAALITANGEIEAGRNCIADVRTKYSGKPAEAEK
jgi:hypothetical protein